MNNFTLFSYKLFAFILSYAIVVSLFTGYDDDLSFSERIVLAFVVISLFMMVALLSKNYGSESLIVLDKFTRSFTLMRLLILGLTIRVFWAVFSGAEPVSDFATYDRMAVDILNGDYILNPNRVTGPSIIFAMHYLFFGYNILFPHITTALLSTVQVFLVYKVIGHITKNHKSAILGSLILTLWPEHILYTNLLGSEVLFSTAILSSVYLLTILEKRNKSGYIIIFTIGFLLGISNWIRPVAPVFLFSFIIYLLMREKRTFINKSYAIIFILFAFILAISPIIIINMNQIGIVSISPAQRAGVSFLIGTNTETKGRCLDAPEVRLVTEEAKKRKSYDNRNLDVIRNEIAFEYATEKIRSNPAQFIELVIKYKIPNYWGLVGGLGWSLNSSILKNVWKFVWGFGEVWHKLFVLLTAYVIFVKINHKRIEINPLVIYLCAALLSTFSHIFLEVQPRYHHVFLPFLAMSLAEIPVISKKLI